MDGLAPNTLYPRNWRLQVYTTQTLVVPNPLGPPQPQTEPTPVVGEPHITATHPAGIETSLTNGLDLSQFRTTFQITAADVETPNMAIIRVYNVGPDTENKLIGGGTQVSEFARVQLQAGYGNNAGVIFDGQIKQIFRGRENPTDTFVIIHAADGDEFYNFSTIAMSLVAGSTPETVANAIIQNATNQGLVSWDKSVPGTLGGILPNPRGQVFWGMSRVYLRRLAQQANAQWSIQNGRVMMTPVDASRAGPIVELTSQTGMIGLPIQTSQGIRIRSLINPAIQVGTLVKLNNRSIQQALQNINRQNLPNPLADPTNLFAHLSNDGLYQVFVIEYRGDSRGNEWYMDLTCLAVDPTTQIPADYVASPPL